MRIVEMLKKINRTLLEMQLGLVVWGLGCQAVGAIFVQNQARYAVSLWFGIALAAISAGHMYHTLDRALDFDEKQANKMIFQGYLVRYASFIIILFLFMVTDSLNPLVIFLAYMGLKVAAFLQPFTHKLCNKII